MLNVSRQVCTGEGPEECRTVYESSCSTKYVESEENQGKFLADTSCEKLPVKICGAGCNYVDGEEECHDKVITTIVNVPEAGTHILTDFHFSIVARIGKVLVKF